MRRRHTRRGIVIALAGLASVASVVWFTMLEPELRVQRMNANESAAIGTLKNISSAQSQLQASGFIDTDGNGAGEYGFFAELAGVAVVRGKRAGDPDSIVAPGVLPPRFGAVEQGRVQLGGYVFQLFLRGRDGGWVAEADAGGSLGRTIDGSRAELEWLCYAWPIERGSTGWRAFVIGQWGDVLALPPRGRPYGGDEAPRAGEAGFSPRGENMPAANTIDACGDLWVVV